MKAYRIVVGYYKDHYGTPTTEKAEYFFNHTDAIKRYKEGAYVEKVTRITHIFKDGTTSIGETGAKWYKRELEDANENCLVELVDVQKNKFRFEEIDIK